MTKTVSFLQSIKGEKSLNFLFLLDQKLKDLDFDLSIDELVVSLSKLIMNCVHILVPGKPMKNHSKSNEWLTNKIKNAIHKRDSLFQKWLSEPLMRTMRSTKNVIITSQNYFEMAKKKRIKDN